MQPPNGALVLALDTTHEIGSVALLRRAGGGTEILEEVEIHAPTGFAHVLYPHLSRLLDRHGVALDSLDAFAAASGPGSFTGIRVGLACIKGLAEATGRPAIGVSNLQALATFGSARLRAVVMDARRGDIYGGLYNSQNQPVAPEVVAKLPAWLATLPDCPLEFVSSNFEPFRGFLSGTRFEETPTVTAGPLLAAAIGKLALARLEAGERPDPAALDANYVRRSDAELFWKE
ncbi:MAG TPA: tRNA (adenosine(37)-N6)-threonylcarbamoyltransferase complex dimerization subunit type 1 TsaB [Bryobacteraceae bacterium]|nr:tRNA (adenosine(37)-N6)-threonylcarbamoyltransferase complex dimerization subunit type 1 TsaB [Bryobacteraceae bacterium]